MFRVDLAGRLRYRIRLAWANGESNHPVYRKQLLFSVTKNLAVVRGCKKRSVVPASPLFPPGFDVLTPTKRNIALQLSSCMGC